MTEETHSIPTGYFSPLLVDMPPKPKKIVEEAIQEDQTVVLPTITRNVLKRVITAPKSEKQMEAFRKAQEVRLQKKAERDRLKQEQEAGQQEQKKQEDEAKIQAGTHTRYQVLPKREAKPKPVPPPIQESESEEEEEEEEEPVKRVPKHRAPVLKEKTTRYYRVKENQRFSTSEAPHRRQPDTETETETDTDYDSDYKKPKRVVRREVKKNLKALKQIDEVLETGNVNVNPYLQFLSNRWK